MDQLIRLLEERLRTATADWEAAREEARVANEKVETLSRAVEAYRQTLAVERKENVAAPEPQSTQAPNDEEQAAEGNKSSIARELIFANIQRGVTPKDVREAFRRAGVSFHANYPYAVLRRFMKNKTVKKIRGRYYPMEPKKAGSE